MALKKSELYSSLWKSCDELRGGMDASQYKDYVLVLLFVKYVSDRYAGRRDALIDVPPGGSFTDMVALKGDKENEDKLPDGQYPFFVRSEFIERIDTYDSLRLPTFQNFAMEVPPTVAEQAAIATVLSDMDKGAGYPCGDLGRGTRFRGHTG
jgi:type I restriction-modification system DNA methylase subunit